MRRGLVRALRGNGLDVLTVAEAGRRRLSDEEQLTFAATQGRAVYTANLADLARLHNRWLGRGLHHAGIIVLGEQLTDVGAQIRALLRLTATLDSTAMRDRLEFLTNWFSQTGV
jgi:hypothetical protein